MKAWKPPVAGSSRQTRTSGFVDGLIAAGANVSEVIASKKQELGPPRCGSCLWVNNECSEDESFYEPSGNWAGCGNYCYFD